MYPISCAHGTASRFNPYPPHYREASNVPFAASSTILYPQAHQRPSRLAFPHPTALEVVVNGGSLQAYHVLCKYPYCVG
jgi:hypothetical protein